MHHTCTIILKLKKVVLVVTFNFTSADTIIFAELVSSGCGGTRHALCTSMTDWVGITGFCLSSAQ